MPVDTPRFRPARREAYLARDPLRAFRVEWDAATREDADELEQVLDEACRNPRAAERERALQRYLEAYPHLLAEYARGGHGRWVIPQKSLGGQHIPDFLIGQLSSDGFGWILVELESPTALMFRKDGDPSAARYRRNLWMSPWHENAAYLPP